MSIGTHSALSQDTPPPHPVPVTHRHGLLTHRDDSRLLTANLNMIVVMHSVEIVHVWMRVPHTTKVGS